MQKSKTTGMEMYQQLYEIIWFILSVIYPMQHLKTTSKISEFLFWGKKEGYFFRFFPPET